MSSDNIHSGHRERLRNRFLATGSAGLNEHELLELLLFYAIPRCNTNSIAHLLLHKFGTLKNVLLADRADLECISGIGSASATFLNIIGTITEQVNAVRDTAFLDTPESVSEYLINYFENISDEVCLFLYLSENMKLISSRRCLLAEIAAGSLSSRELIEDVLVCDSRKLVIGISHPSRFPIPSENDYKIIKLFAEPLSYVSTDITDAVICGRGRSFSMRCDGAFSF